MMQIEVSEIVIQHDDNKMIETWNVRWGVVNSVQLKSPIELYERTVGFFDIAKKDMSDRDSITSTGKGFIKEMITMYNYNIDTINGIKLDEVKHDDITNENPFYWFIEGVLLGRKDMKRCSLG